MQQRGLFIGKTPKSEIKLLMKTLNCKQSDFRIVCRVLFGIDFWDL